MEHQASNCSTLTRLTPSTDIEINVAADYQILKKALLGHIRPVTEWPSLCQNNILYPNEVRKGRPKAELLNTLILEGSSSSSSIKCKYCGRVFPREKSLKVHLRTHTGEKPYACDYPRCHRRFTQSGQLKTHQRLHTGEKPFICSGPNCSRRFTHAHRRCPNHPDHALDNFVDISKTESDLSEKYDEIHNAEVRKWLQNWERDVIRHIKTTTMQ